MSLSEHPYARHVTHGLSKTPEYNVWGKMKSRCYNSNSPDFPAYGARGITVCEEWLNDFAQFYSDMGPRPSPTHSIDRKDGTKGYCKENCRWATKEEQAQNRPEFVIPLTLGDKTQTIAEWARERGIFPQTLYNRHKAGWSDERALTQEPSNQIRKDNRFLEFNGQRLTVAQWTRRLGLSRNCLKQRLCMGWSVKRALSHDSAR